MTRSRDTQELSTEVGRDLCLKFPKPEVITKEVPKATSPTNVPDKVSDLKSQGALKQGSLAEDAKKDLTASESTKDNSIQNDQEADFD